MIIIIWETISVRKTGTCNAPMPAFPRVHMDGAAANAFANACLYNSKEKAKVNKGKIYLQTHYNQRGKMFLKFS